MLDHALQTHGILCQLAGAMGTKLSPVDHALEQATRALSRAGIPYAVAGGLAVMSHGYERFTKDVDLLIPASDLARALTVLTTSGFTGGRTPIGARLTDDATGVEVDLLGTAFDADEKALADAVSAKRRGQHPVISAEHLVLMKLEAGRIQDQADIVALLHGGLSAAKVRRYLKSAWPDLLDRFETVVGQAKAERAAKPRRGPKR